MTPCKVFEGSIVDSGYGRIYGGGRHKYRLAHRVAWEAANGPIPEGMQIDHLCRNRACVNPDHLEPVTSRINTLRGVSPAAKNVHKTHCLRGHPLSGENLYVDRKGKRSCRVCKRAAEKRYRAKNKAAK